MALALCSNATEVDQPIDAITEASVSGGLLNGKTTEERQTALLRHCTTLQPKDRYYPKHAVSAFLPRVLLNVEMEQALKQWIEAARRTFTTARDKLAANPQDVRALNPFDKQALLHSWLLAKDRTKLPPDIEEMTKGFISLWHHKVWKGYGALNYRLMMDGSGFLAAEQWPDLTDADGLKSEEIKAATKGRLLGYFDDIVHHNHHEYGAPTYGGADLSAMKMLADFAQDIQVRDRATLTLDWMLLNVACSWNQGYNVSPAGRAKYLSSTITSPDAMDQTATIGWLYFGAQRAIHGESANHAFWFACPGRYQLPDLIVKIAQDRGAPLTHRGSFKVKNTEVRYTIYHTPEYSLASQAEFLSGPTHDLYKETRRQMLKWLSAHPFSTFAPMQDNARRPYALQEKVANVFGYGENPFGQSLQNNDTLVGIIAVPDDYPYYKLYAPFPTTGSILQRIEHGGWVCCHAGSMLFAFRTLQPWSWGKSRETDHCDVLWSDARRNGWILETTRLTPFAGGGVEAELKRFAQALEQRTKVEDVSWDLPEPHFRYNSLDGHRMEIRYRPFGQPYHDQHKIDGEVVDYASFALLDNPSVQQKLDGDALILNHAGKILKYDFKEWTRTEEAR